MKDAILNNPNDPLEVVEERVQEAAEVLKAMASESRLIILCALNDAELPVGELASLAGQSQSATSQHLAKLRAANLVETRRDGQTIYYRCTGGVGSVLVQALCDFYG